MHFVLEGFHLLRNFKLFLPDLSKLSIHVEDNFMGNYAPLKQRQGFLPSQHEGLSPRSFLPPTYLKFTVNRIENQEKRLST